MLMFGKTLRARSGLTALAGGQSGMYLRWDPDATDADSAAAQAAWTAAIESYHAAPMMDASGTPQQVLGMHTFEQRGMPWELASDSVVPWRGVDVTPGKLQNMLKAGKHIRAGTTIKTLEKTPLELQVCGERSVICTLRSEVSRPPSRKRLAFFSQAPETRFGYQFSKRIVSHPQPCTLRVRNRKTETMPRAQGMLSSTYRLTMTYEGGPGPARLIAKFQDMSVEGLFNRWFTGSTALCCNACEAWAYEVHAIYRPPPG
jgi:hypothetical protein